ncbi:hypothetical protein BN7_3415 [Wickerhamomyces ciferrii]|uniref:FAD/NAD(P)-binding domain-containing protein n=1 Tax=Wickerhamomyces ciferrii (strain ATCC 14091 / BCRC 22168 / CBS 111 / JCM 3599 / NBRC 0793 / NRRL Y-1031 F-60-10) TaxID=1206466 RepID=K0KLL0_WICCF|nr:uncharacterized protein BN7_3415 [Wickerhamomyces ciferrii]CCH43861.1 hypothetical protein BN7_3415 [Wickerhamomyces ciferrii]
MTEVFDIPETNFKEVIIIGGGPCGLATASRLCEETPGAIFSDGEHQRFHWLRQRGNATNIIGKKKRSLSKSNRRYTPDEIMVLDKVSDRFMGQWDNQFEAVDIPHLRSPMFFHPDPNDIDGLLSFAHSSGRQNELKEINGVVGQEITKHQQKKMRSKRKNSMEMKSSKQKNVGLVEIDHRNRFDYYRPGTKLFHDFCESLVNRYELENVVRQADVVDIKYGEVNKIMLNGEIENGMGFQIETADGDIFGCKVAILAVGPAGEPNYPLLPEIDNKFGVGSCHAAQMFRKQAMVPTQRMQDKINMKKHTEVVVIGGGLTSAQLTELLVKKGVGKIHYVIRGEIKIKHFDFHLEWVTKYQNFMKSTFWMKDTDMERYEMIEDARGGGSVNPQYHKVLMKLADMGKIEIHKHCEIKDKVWDEEKQLWSNVEFMDKINNTTKTFTDIDYILYATGIKADVESLPMMKSICTEHPIEVIKGRFAMLRTGPSSANLDGGRIGAERIGWYVQHLKETGSMKYQKIVSIDGQAIMSDEKPEVKEIEYKSDKVTDMMKCTGGRVNWYSFLDTAAA